jgi:hypothetical protein
MKPSEVVIDAIPFVGTFGRSQIEIAVALIVRTCALGGDTWGPCTLDDVMLMITNEVTEKAEPIASMAGNPFVRPDWHSLISAGWATQDGGTGAIELTPKAVEALEKWRRS